MAAIIAVLSSWVVLACALGFSIYIYQRGENFDIIAHASEYGCEDARSNFYKSICIFSSFIVISASINAIACANIYRWSENFRLRIISIVQFFTIASFFFGFESKFGLAKPCVLFCIGYGRCISDALNINLTFFGFWFSASFLNIYPIGNAFFPNVWP